MRLIDAQAVMDDFNNRLHKDTPFVALKKAVDGAPTIDAEPVRYGKLKTTDAYPHRVYCSECYKTLIPNVEWCYEKNEFPQYCMWCGAKMDKEEQA